MAVEAADFLCGKGVPVSKGSTFNVPKLARRMEDTFKPVLPALRITLCLPSYFLNGAGHADAQNPVVRAAAET